MSGQDYAELARLYDMAADWARRTGVRQRIRWASYPGELASCSEDFAGGFCCGEKPYVGWSWTIVGVPRERAV